MRTLLSCHEGEPLNRLVLPRWLASFSTLAGVLVLEEPKQRKWKRFKREMKRVGLFRFLDVLFFRTYYSLFLARTDRDWETAKIAELCERYPEIPADTPIFRASSPNSEQAREFLKRCAPDVVIARCKSLLKEEVFSIPTAGTFVMHPGICPEYRNAHGCFWALASRDVERVGMTLLKIDKGVDTGPVYGYFYPAFDETSDSHVVIQLRSVFDNLDSIAAKLGEIADGSAATIDTTGRASATWGQPWMSKYVRWKMAARSSKALSKRAET